MGMLEGFILALLLEATAKLSYDWCLVAESGTICIWKKLHRLAGPTPLEVSALTSKDQGMQMLKQEFKDQEVTDKKVNAVKFGAQIRKS